MRGLALPPLSAILDTTRSCETVRLPFDFQEMCINAVESELKMLEVNKAKGWNAIPLKILRLTAKGIALSLMRLSGANEEEHATPIPSLRHGIFTDRSIFSISFLCERMPAPVQ